MRPELHIAKDERALVTSAADWIEELLRTEVREGQLFSMVLAGGSTPGPVYAELVERQRRQPLPWGQVAIYFGDERCVGPADPDSNYAEARRTLLEPIGEERFAAVHRMRGEQRDVEAEAERYAALLPGRFDLVLLGVGEDGHTASLFPGQASLAESERKVLAVVGPKPPPQRLTLAPGPLREAKCVLVLCSGSGKAAAVTRALEGPFDPSATPIQLALPSEPGQQRVWFLDEAAAAGLRDA